MRLVALEAALWEGGREPPTAAELAAEAGLELSTVDRPLEHAQRFAGHASPKTTKLYDRTADEIERIVI